VILASAINPLLAISLAEVLNTSDVPAGIVNILTGDRKELLSHFASHKDVNAIIYCGDNLKEIKVVEEMATENLKRVSIYRRKNWVEGNSQSPYFIEKCQEIKTIWHPTEV
jgi:acyl-CoA reductase-like NAD-dependent aldehyde dehydrogenase